jgi:hypothetical protein
VGWASSQGKNREKREGDFVAGLEKKSNQSLARI